MVQHFFVNFVDKERSYLDICSNCFFSGQAFVSREYLLNKKEKNLKVAFFIFSIISFLFCSAWLYSWSVLSNETLNIEEYLFKVFSFWFRWYVFVLVISVFVCAYLAVIVFAGFVQILYSRPLNLCLCHKIASPLSLITCIVFLCVIGLAWSNSEQWHAILTSFDITGPFLQLAALISWVLLSIYIFLNIHDVRNTKAQLAIHVLYTMVLLFLLTLPFWLYSPCIGKEHDKLVKPLIIGHRGAPSFAPENTILSFQKAVEHGVYALETDVRMSVDGVAFLLHDDTLLRTTNVAQVFPQRKYDRAETFTWSELRQLNAGKWYLQVNPFLNKESFNQSEREEINAQKIPSFVEFVSFAAENNISIIFDLFSSSSNATGFVKTVLHDLIDSDLPPTNVIWPLRNINNWKAYRAIAPDFRLMSYHMVPNPSAYTIDIINLPYNIVTEKTIGLNALVIEYVVDTNWAFSRAWCQETWAVTTNYCSFLESLSEPSWAMSTLQYFITWSCIDIIALVTVGFIWQYCRKKIQIERVQQISRVFDEDF